MDVKGRITFFNEFAQNFFGYKEEEILGKNVIGTIVPLTDDSGQDLKAMIDDIMLNPKKYINNENENTLRCGKRAWISWTNKPIIDKDGRLQEVLSIGNDITRLKQTETELLKAKELAEAASRAGTVICDADWKLMEMNASARNYFNMDSAAIPGGDFLRVMFKNYTASIPKNEIIDLSKVRKAFDLIRPETEENKALYLQVSMEVIKNHLHEIMSIVLVLQDVTSMRQEEMMKQDFLGLISHKLHTPIASIFGNTQMLLDEKYFGALSDKQKPVVEIVLKETRLLLDLIDRLLKFVEINRVRPDLKMETIEL
ncbi:MAG: PAS domain S-box protein, partial [Candidatus Omnitrophica bacterium]|nr:PAS domain S-box protein [Candidatus Omnitrophota bacterium]